MSGEKNKFSNLLTCSQILNLMVILGFMFNYMLRVNLNIAIVVMIAPQNTTNMTQTPSTGPQFKWNEAQKNDILGSILWGYILTELPGGRLAELIGTRRVFGGCMLLSSLLTLFTPAACHTNYYVILVLRAVLGLLLGFTWPAIIPMATHWIPPLERSKFIANIAASSLGAALTLPVCGYLIANVGWPSVFYVTGTVGVIWSCAWFWFVYDSPQQHPRIEAEERDEIMRRIALEEGGSANIRKKSGKKQSKVPWKSMLRSAPVWTIVIAHGCSVTCFHMVVIQLPSYMKQVLDFDIKRNGLLSSLPFVGKYVMAVSASYLADRIRKSGRLSTTVTRKIFDLFAEFVPALLMTVQAFFGYDAILSIVVFSGTLFANGAGAASFLSNGLDIAPNFSGTIFGLANTASSLGGWLSTKVVTALTEEKQTFQQWRNVFWFMVALYSTAGVIFFVFSTSELQTWNSEPVEEEEAENVNMVNGKETANGIELQEMQLLNERDVIPPTNETGY